METLVYFYFFWKFWLDSQAPEVPKLAHQGIFQLSRLSVNCYVKTMKKYLLHLNRRDFMKILPELCVYLISNFSMVKNRFRRRKVSPSFKPYGYLFGVLSTCENVCENFEEIWPRLERLGQIWHIGRLGSMLFRAHES